ncbi:MAG: glutamate mutase L, partial [Rudaea sp.]
MAQTPICESILIADCGAVATKVALVDRVGGDFRLIGIARTPTTAEPPVSDISTGVRRAIRQLETLAGRPMLTGEGELIAPETQEGSGVDAFVAVTSAAAPLRAVVVGLSRDQSVAFAQRALAGTSVIVQETVAVDEESGRWGTNAKDGVGGGPSVAVEQVLALQPDLIVMTGGTDGGASAPLVELANIVACIAQALDPANRPVVVFAGNRDARAAVAERIGSTTEFRATENIMPRLKAENFRPLQDEVQAVQFERKVKALPGLDKLVSWSARPLTSALAASERVVEFLAKRHNLRVQALET